MEYELTTIKDIFIKVPADKIEQCIKELGVMLVEAKAMVNIFEICGEICGEKEQVCRFPDTIVWVDDDKKEVVNTYMVNGKEFMKTTQIVDEDRK